MTPMIPIGMHGLAATTLALSSSYTTTALIWTIETILTYKMSQDLPMTIGNLQAGFTMEDFMH